MCSVPGLPDVGTSVTVHITSVHLKPHSVLVKFGGKLHHEQETKEVYQQIQKDFEDPNKRHDFEGNPGEVCLVYEGKTWHRARILSRYEHEYNVFLIDDGKLLSASSRILAKGQCNLSSLPPTVELCVLTSVSPLCLESTWSAAAVEFIRSLTGKSVSGHVQDVLMPYRIILLDIPGVSKQMYELGFAKRTPDEDLRNLVTSSLHSPRESTPKLAEFVMANGQKEHSSDPEKLHKYLYPELLPGTIEIVTITQVVHPLKIFCKLQVFSQELKKLRDQLHVYYEDTFPSLMLTPLSVGSPCATKGSDGRWYRSVLQQNTVTDVIKVFHVDYGIGDFVKLCNIRPLSARFLQLPVVTYACSLCGIIDKDIGWRTDQIDYLKSLLLEQTYIGKFELYSLDEDVYYITLYGMDHVNINHIFGLKEQCLSVTERLCADETLETVNKLAYKDLRGRNPSNTETHPEKPPVGYNGVHCNGEESQNSVKLRFDEHFFIVGSIVELNVTYIDSSGKFWCQLTENASGLRALMEDMQRYYACSQFQQPTESTCVVWHPHKDMWCRAKIISEHLTSHVDVQLVDYGQNLKVPLQDIRPIDPGFLKLKSQAFQCSLFSSSLKDVSSELNRLEKLMSPVSVPLKCIIREVMFDSRGEVLHVVDIQSQTHIESLCNLKGPTNSLANSVATSQNDAYVVLPPKIEVGAKAKVWITCVRGVSQFYGHFEQNTDVVKKMTKDIQQLCRKIPKMKFSVSPKMMCLAKYSDGQWHRGQIESTHPKILVDFVDYGDLVPLDKSEIQPLTSKASAIKSIPIQAVQFELFGVTLPQLCDLNEWFKKYATDGMFTVIVMKKNPSGKLSVEVYDEKTNINLKMKEKWNKTKRTECTVNKRTDATCTFRVPSGAMEPKVMRHSLSTIHAHEDICGKVAKPAVQSNLRLKTTCTTGHNTANDVLCQQVHQQQQVISPYPKFKDLPSRTLNVGRILEVYVSHCNSPSSFFVQLTSEEDEIFSLVDKLNSSPLTDAQVDLNLLQPGDIVSAEYPADGAWYRAVVQNKRGSLVQVQFFDFGNEATLSPPKIRQLGKQFLSTPKFSIHCCLEDGSSGGERDWTKEEITAFKIAMGENGEKKILCNFIREDVSAWLVSLKHKGFEFEGPLPNMSHAFKSGAKTESLCIKDIQLLTFKEPVVTHRQIIDAYASSIVGPNYFWCQFKDSKELDRISLIAQEIGNSTQTKPIQPDRLCPGGPCLARFSDEMWYRARIINKCDHTVSVLFIDYGNESEIDQNSVKSLSPDLLESPPQAFLCRLDFGSVEGTLSDAAADKFFELLVDEPLKVTIQNRVITSDFPGCPQYNVLVECKGLLVNDLIKDYCCDPKAPLCSQVTENNRAKHTVPEHDNFGDKQPVTTETVEENATPKLISGKLSSRPSHNNINPDPHSCGVDVSLIESNQEKCQQQDACLERLNKPATQCEIKDQSIISPMKEIGLPLAAHLPPRLIKPDVVSEVYISHVNSITSFFVQLVEDEDALFSLTELLNSPQSEKDIIHVSSVQQGNLVKALYPEDDSWYRAVVKDITENDMVNVEFLDFGNEATVSPLHICRLNEGLLSYPRFSIHCSFNAEDQFKIQRGLKEKTFLFKKVFGEVGENKLCCKFIKDGITTWEVKLNLKGSTSDSSLGNLCDKWDDFDLNTLQSHSPKQMLSPTSVSSLVKDASQQFKQPELSLGQMVEAFASCIVGPNYFWCQFSNSEKLDQISVMAQEYGNSSQTKLIQMDHLEPGSPCLACFSDDQLWYRAKVINKSSNKIFVLFVDYGNESEIDESSIKTLPCKLLESPLQAFLCQLRGFGPSEGSWDSTAADHFYELLVDKSLKVTVQCIQNMEDSGSPLYSVTIETKDCLVNEFMNTFWSASVCYDQKSAEMTSCEETIASTSGDQPVSEDEVSVTVESLRENNQTSKPHCCSVLGTKQVEESIINGDWQGGPKNKVDDQLGGKDMIPAVTNSSDIANVPTRKSLPVLENHKGSPESDNGLPVASDFKEENCCSEESSMIQEMQDQKKVCTEDPHDEKEEAF